MSEKPLVFRSKVDKRLVVISVSFLLGIFVLALWMGIGEGNMKALVFIVICELFTVGGILAIMLPVHYELGKKTLKVRTGVIYTEVSLDSIKEIGKCRSILSGPSLSFDRLRIDYDNNGYAAYVLISPEDQQRFMQEVELRRN